MLINICPNCQRNNIENGYSICDNNCGTNICDCNTEYYNVEGVIIPGHNPNCGELDDEGLDEGLVPDIIDLHYEELQSGRIVEIYLNGLTDKMNEIYKKEFNNEGYHVQIDRQQELRYRYLILSKRAIVDGVLPPCDN